MKNREIKVLLSAPRGFCAGVERAIEIVKKSIKKYGAPVYVRHEIVHNKHVVDSLKAIGAIFVEELEEIEDKTRPVIFSAHGVPKSIPLQADGYNMEYIDATCPLVSKVHREAENLHKAGYHIILIGHNNHPEVIGTMGQLPENTIDLIQDEHDVELYELDDNKKIAYVTQTTLSVDDTKNIIKALKKNFHKLKNHLKKIFAMQLLIVNQLLKILLKQCDMFFVLGSRNSSNSVRLVEVAEQAGCPHAELIHSESEIPFEKIQNCKTIGVSSGASAPEVLVENFINKLKDNFKIKIEEVEIIKENIVFKVPAKLN